MSIRQRRNPTANFALQAQNSTLHRQVNYAVPLCLFIVTAAAAAAAAGIRADALAAVTLSFLPFLVLLLVL